MKLTVLGCCGRMGREVMKHALALENTHRDFSLFGALTHKDSAHCGQSVGDLLGGGCTVQINDKIHETLASSDVVIDFSVNRSVAYHSELAAQAGAAYVCCVTGLNAGTLQTLALASSHVAVVNAPNTSLGVNALISLTEKLASMLTDYDIDIIDYHHRHKRDAPSGTALELGKAAVRGRGNNAAQVSHNITSDGERKQDAIGYAVVRAGEIIGEHKVLFSGTKERVELVHKASDRGVFAEGALKAALWAVKQEPGLYTMQHVLENR